MCEYCRWHFIVHDLYVSTPMDAVVTQLKLIVINLNVLNTNVFCFFCCSHRFMCVFLMHVVQICMVQVWLIALANIYSWSTTLLILQMETLNTALVLCTILSNQVEQSMLYYYILLELSLLAIKCMLPLRLCMIKFHTCIDNKTAFSKHVVLVYQSLPATN